MGSEKADAISEGHKALVLPGALGDTSWQSNRFLYRLESGDETWMYYRNFGHIMECMQRKHKTCPTHKKSKMKSSAGKAMEIAIAFWRRVT